QGKKWEPDNEPQQHSLDEFWFPTQSSQAARVHLPWKKVRQFLTFGFTNIICTAEEIVVQSPAGMGRFLMPASSHCNQVALSLGGIPHAATDRGLMVLNRTSWERLGILDKNGRDWGTAEMLGLAFDIKGQLWIATRAGVGCRLDGE